MIFKDRQFNFLQLQMEFIKLFIIKTTLLFLK